jgi:quercetin dioxygenase-like cupin family protein
MTRALFFVLWSATAASAQSPPEIVPVDKEPMHKLVLDNEYVRVFYVTVPPHGETKFHRHDRDYIFVTLGDSEVESERVAEKPVKLTLKDGEARFTKGGFAHRAKNLSEKPFRNVTVEFKRPVNDSGGRVSDCMALCSDCVGHCMDRVVEAANVRCGRYTGAGGGTISVKSPVLVVRTTSANTPELVEVTTKSGRESLISFYKSPEGPTSVSLAAPTDVTVCTFTPTSGK